jgi:hypothetical protein
VRGQQHHCGKQAPPIRRISYLRSALSSSFAVAQNLTNPLHPDWMTQQLKGMHGSILDQACRWSLLSEPADRRLTPTPNYRARQIAFDIAPGRSYNDLVIGRVDAWRGFKGDPSSVSPLSAHSRPRGP